MSAELPDDLWRDICGNLATKELAALSAVSQVRSTLLPNQLFLIFFVVNSELSSRIPQALWVLEAATRRPALLQRALSASVYFKNINVCLRFATLRSPLSSSPPSFRFPRSPQFIIFSFQGRSKSFGMPQSPLGLGRRAGTLRRSRARSDLRLYCTHQRFRVLRRCAHALAARFLLRSSLPRVACHSCFSSGCHTSS